MFQGSISQTAPSDVAISRNRYDQTSGRISMINGPRRTAQVINGRFRFGQLSFTDHPSWEAGNKHKYFASRGFSTCGRYANTVKHRRRAVDSTICGCTTLVGKKAHRHFYYLHGDQENQNHAQ